MKECIICSKELQGNQLKYCSASCKQKAHYTKHKTNSNTTYSQYKRADVRKKQLINMLGGCCSKCGYKTNYAALEFHHVSNKSFSLDSRRLANSSMKKIMAELEKCTLLCANCHREYHYPDLLL